MIRSMTGFGEASTEVDGVHYYLEVRSLNNKYFKCSMRLADELQTLEPEIESELRRRLNRGTLTVIARVQGLDEAAAMGINHRALDRYIDQLQQSKHAGNGTLRFDAGTLLALPGVLQPLSDDEQRIERARVAVHRMLDEACEHLVSMRTREGAMLSEELMVHHAAIQRHLKRIADRVPTVVDEYQSRLLQRVRALLSDAEVRIDSIDLIREVAVYAERSDIAEEVARLGAHLDQFDALLRSDDGRAIGRTLEFLSQEMLREANTIASKSSDAEISRDTVEIKGAIDRIKEQVMNVE
ncbi:MAG: YicC/YloC family endoribonuclease [Phycisphaerales bacterium]